MNYLHKILNNCEEVSRLALQSEETTLPFRQRLEVKIHLYYCRCCSNFVKQSRIMDASFRHYFHQLENNPPFTASREYKTGLKEKLK